MKTVLTYCLECDRETTQKILFSKKLKTDEKENIGIETGYEDYMVIECGGCKTNSFLYRITSVHSEHGETFLLDENFPKHSDRWGEFNFLKEEDQDSLPRQIYDLYEEIKMAFENDSNVLAGIGLRTLVEAICLQQKMTGDNLKIKINNLHTNGLISTSEKPILDKLRDIGNASAHQIKAFPIDKLEYALGIVNHVLMSIYILPKLNKKLKL